MKKIWFVKGTYSKGKVFKTEQSFLNAVRDDDKRQVFIFELVESGISGEIKQSIINSRDRDNQLKNILGETNKYEKAIIEFKSKFSEIAPDSNYKKIVLRKFKLIGLDKKEFSKMAIEFRRYLLFEVSNTVEWYETLLRCHNFISIPKNWTSYYSNKIDIETNIQSFNDAKKNLKKKVK